MGGCLSKNEEDQPLLKQTNFDNKKEKLSECVIQQPISSQACPPALPFHHDASIENKEWYHGQISSVEAESRMESAQEDGSYLVYYDEGHGYVLLVSIQHANHKETVKLNITRNQDFYSLEGGASSHKSVKELVKAHRGKTGKKISYEQDKQRPFCLSKIYIPRPIHSQPNPCSTDDKGRSSPSSISTKSAISDIGDHTQKKWYHKDISPNEADKRLLEGAQGINGSYLVYDHPREEGNFVLLVYCRSKTEAKGEIYRWKISKTKNGHYILGEESEDKTQPKEYNSVKELIKAHRGATGKPIRLNNGEMVILSKSYVMCVD